MIFVGKYFFCYILLKSGSHLRNFCFICFKNDEKYFLFHLKSSFRSQDIYVFVLTFWACSKNGLIRKISLTSKFMTSHPGWQRIAINILLNISRIKGNQTKKFVQLIEYNKNIFFKNHTEN